MMILLPAFVGWNKTTCNFTKSVKHGESAEMLSEHHSLQQVGSVRIWMLAVWFLSLIS